MLKSRTKIELLILFSLLSGCRHAETTIDIVGLDTSETATAMADTICGYLAQCGAVDCDFEEDTCGVEIVDFDTCFESMHENVAENLECMPLIDEQKLL